MAQQAAANWQANLATGLLAGIAGTLLMNGYFGLVKRLFKPQPSSGQSGLPTTAKVAEKVIKTAGIKQPSRELLLSGGNAVHWGYGITWGAIAGLSRLTPVPLDAFAGQPLGAALWAFGDLWMLYKLGFAKHPREYPTSLHAKALGAHLVYGAGVWLTLEGLSKLTASPVAESSGVPRAA